MSRRSEKVDKQEGMALVLTLMAVSFLVAITVQITSSVSWQMQGAGNLRDSVQLDAINRSGLSLVRAALSADLKDNQHDSKHDSWNTLGGEEISSLFGKGKLEVKVTDLSGLIQVNALEPPDPKKIKNKKKLQDALKLHGEQIKLWQRLLTSEKFAVADAAEAEELIDAIIDWVDENETERAKGAESGYYLALSPSYSARNAPVIYLEELLLIRGMTKDLFYGNKDDSYLPLKDFLTVAGREGKININTAPEELLMALDPDGNMTLQNAKDLIEFRDDEDNKTKLGNLQWYRQVNGGLQLEESLVDVKSSFFKVLVTAEHEKMKRSSEGVLERVDNKGVQKLRYWEVR